MRERQRIGDSEKAWHPFAAEIILLAEELCQRLRVKFSALAQLQRRHHPVSQSRIRHCVYGCNYDIRVTGQHLFDLGGTNILPVDTDAVTVPTDKVKGAFP